MGKKRFWKEWCRATERLASNANIAEMSMFNSRVAAEFSCKEPDGTRLYFYHNIPEDWFIFEVGGVGVKYEMY